MKVLHLSDNDLIGGRFTGYYMQRAFDATEHQFEMAVWNRQSDSVSVNLLRPKHPLWARVINKIAVKTSEKLGLEGLTGLGSYLLTRKPYFQSADILHLHIIHNDEFFNILDLPRLSRLKPTVWTIHDFWAFSGMCIYPFDCMGLYTGCHGNCPYPRGKSVLRHYIPAAHWQVKKIAYEHSDIHLVVASRWLCERIQKSPLLKKIPITHIPFGIDLTQFRQRNKEAARAKLGIPQSDQVISTRAASKKHGYSSYLYKGIEWLREALEIYEPKKPTTLLVFQDSLEFEHLKGKYRIVNLRWADGDLLVDALSAADVFVMPSIQETFGLMAVEAMACGVPVVVFDGTSLPEVIQAPRGGLVVPSKDSAALASAFSTLLEDDELRYRISQTARALTEEQYNLFLYVQRHLSLYQEILDKRSAKTNAEIGS
jgi:glycosyltransferase involved in cell wall biosynthesis